MVTWSDEHGAFIVDGQPVAPRDSAGRTAPVQGHFRKGKRGPRSRFDPDKDDDAE